ncbi:MAG: lipopolysaccharide biosynthesis protein, partial [Candidatus Acidiferrum sp.]
MAYIISTELQTSEHNLMTSPVKNSFEMPRRGDLANLARRGLGWSFALQFGRYAVSMASTAVLARLVSPGDYGLLAMVATITVLAQAISDFGLSWATVQREQLDRNQIDSLFFMNCAFGLFLTIICFLTAPYVAKFYHHAELTKIVIACSGVLLLSAVAVQPTALLRRQMKLKELSACALWSLTISAVISMFLAWLGFGYWALVAQLVLQQVIATVLSFPMSRYYPRLPLNFLNIGTLLTFGGYSAAYGIVNYFARNLDNVLIGKVWGAVALGYYSRAYFLMTLPGMLVIAGFSGVLIPSLASLRKEPDRMQSAYLRAIRLITVLGCSVAVGLAATATEAVELVYGPKWHAVVPIMLWLSAASILQPIQNTAQWLYIVAERGRGMFLMGLLVAGSAVLAFALSIRFGPVAVARSYAISNTIIAFPVLLMAHRACGLHIKKTIAESAPLVLCALIMGAVVYLVGIGLNCVGAGLHARLAMKVIVGIGAYAGCLRLLAYRT